MSKVKKGAKVLDMASWKARKSAIQSQEDYIRGLCERCGGGCPPSCGETDLKRLAEIQREIILDLLGGSKPSREEKEPGGKS
jgi:hypothetical protein